MGIICVAKGSSHQKVFLKISTKFTGKHQCWSLRGFPVNFVKFCGTHFFAEHHWQLLLIILRIRSRCQWYEEGEKSNFLPNLEKFHAGQSRIHKINDICQSSTFVDS